MVDRDCKEYDSECKYFHHEPYYTPNNYDLFFDYNSIPVNIPVEKAHDLRNRLQKLMPLTKIIHLNMGSETFEEDNNIHLHTKLKLGYKTPLESTDTKIKLMGEWPDFDETDEKSDVNYEVYSLYGGLALENVTIRLINKHHPTKEYTGTTDDEGKCVIENVVHGSYIEQVLLNDFSIPLQTVEINENTNTQTRYIGSENQNQYEVSEDENDILLYIDGVFKASNSLIVSYTDGLLETGSDETYDDGVFTIGDSENEYDDSTLILLHSAGFNAINDLTQVIVEIKNNNDEIVDTIRLNFKNNYTGLSKKLPIYDNEEQITYTFNYEETNFTLNHEYLDIQRFKENEVVLL